LVFWRYYTFCSATHKTPFSGDGYCKGNLKTPRICMAKDTLSGSLH
jgi:hypothetical protein